MKRNKYIKLFEEKYESWDILAMSSDQINELLYNEVDKEDIDLDYISSIIEWGGSDVDFEYSDGEYNIIERAVIRGHHEFASYLLNNVDIDVKDLVKYLLRFNYDEYEFENSEEEQYDIFIGYISKIWNDLKKHININETLLKIKDLSYDEASDSYTLCLKELEDLEILWNFDTYSGRNYDTSTLKNVLSEDRYGLFDFYYSYDSYESYMFDELNPDGVKLVRDIILNNANDIDDIDEFDLNTDRGIESFLDDSDSETAEEIKRELRNSYSTVSNDTVISEMYEYFIGEAVEFLTGRGYNSETDFKYSSDGYILKGIRMSLIRQVFSFIFSSGWGTCNFLDCLHIPEEERIEYDLSNFDSYYSPDINSDDFTDAFSEYIAGSDINISGITYKNHTYK